MEELGISFRSGLGEPIAEPPIYRRIADSIAARIARGELEPGDRLPNHRDLATEFKVNVTTITRAFHTLKRRGLVETRPGRGTVILDFRNGAGRFQSNPTDERGVFDLSVNRPAAAGYLDALADLMPRLARDRRYASLKDYQPAEGPTWLREAAALWMRSFCLAGSISFHTRLTSAGAGFCRSSDSSLARFASRNDGRADASIPATAPSTDMDALPPAGADGTSETGPDTDAARAVEGAAWTVIEVAGAVSAGTTKAPVSPETTEVTVSTAAKPTSTPSGSLRERAS